MADVHWSRRRFKPLLDTFLIKEEDLNRREKLEVSPSAVGQ